VAKATQLAVTPVTNGSVGQDGIIAISNQSNPVWPLLQASDGTYFGTAYGPSDPSTGDSGANLIVAFHQAGQLKYSLPGNDYWPDHVDSADHLVAWSDSRQAMVTLDSSGNAIGQSANGLVQSWTGSGYQYGSVESVAVMPTEYSSSYGATTGGNPSQSGTAVPSLGAIYRSTVAQLAKENVGNSTNWRETNGTTCNLFVRDILTQASDTTSLKIPAPVRPNLKWYQSSWRHPFLAADWANPGMDGGCWKPLLAGPDGALPGDVIATGFPPNGPDTTGHVGIVVEGDATAPNYIDASAADVPPYWWNAAQKQSFIPGTITLTDYGFRSPGFDTANPQDNQGLKQDSWVRRFECY
jgi:hypothetical protein